MYSKEVCHILCSMVALTTPATEDDWLGLAFQPSKTVAFNKALFLVKQPSLVDKKKGFE